MKRILLFPLVLLATCSATLQAGPPFQTDDPEPVDYKHYEFYTFSLADSTRIETDTFGPATEFNWGAVPNVQVHLIVPATAAFPSDAPAAFGLGDIETGIKYRFVQEAKHRPMVGTFTMLELPTGDATRALGVGHLWARIPIWLQKSFGPWTTYGGGGAVISHAPGTRDYPFSGWLLQRDIGKKWTLGGEVFYHGPEGAETLSPRPATMIDLGGYYYFRIPGFQLLFAYGHNITGQTENYAYLGLYWTWGGHPSSNN
jgi:hypothetical protein